MMVRHADIENKEKMRHSTLLDGESTAFFCHESKPKSLSQQESFSLLTVTLSLSVFGIACGTQYDLSKRNDGSKRSITSMRSMRLARAVLIG